MWLASAAPDRGYRQLPSGGMCLSAFLFVCRGQEILLGRYADDPRWEELTGLDEDRRQTHGRGWTIPSSHLRYGENPRTAGARVAREVLGLDGVSLTEPRVETETYVPVRFPELGEHYDIWFFFETEVPEQRTVEAPPWYEELAWQDPRALGAHAFARSHADVVERWLQVTEGPT